MDILLTHREESLGNHHKRKSPPCTHHHHHPELWVSQRGSACHPVCPESIWTSFATYLAPTLSCKHIIGLSLPYIVLSVFISTHLATQCVGDCGEVVLELLVA